jgi:hypothetical protein
MLKVVALVLFMSLIALARPSGILGPTVFDLRCAASLRLAAHREAKPQVCHTS